MITREQCRDCHDDFYNGDDRRCWSAKTGKMDGAVSNPLMQVPTAKGAFTKVRKPSCYHQVDASMFYNTLPAFVKAGDLNREKRT